MDIMLLFLLYLLPLISSIFNKKATLVLSAFAILLDAYIFANLIFFLFASAYLIILVYIYRDVSQYALAFFTFSFFLFNLIGGGMQYLVVVILYSFLSIGIIANANSKDALYNYFVGSIIGVLMIAISLLIGNSLLLVISLLFYLGSLPFNWFLFKAYFSVSAEYNSLLFAAKAPLYLLLLNTLSFNLYFLLFLSIILYIPLIIAFTRNEYTRLIAINLSQLGFIGIIGAFSNAALLVYSLAIGEAITFLSYSRNYYLAFDLSILGLAAIPVSLAAIFKILGLIAIINQTLLLSFVLPFLAIEGFLLIPLLKQIRLSIADFVLSLFIFSQLFLL
jgi:hypothetical protein